MNKWDKIEDILAKGGSYQHEVLKLLCEISELLGMMVNKPEKIVETIKLEPKSSYILTEKQIRDKTSFKKVAKKRGRPKKK